MVIARFLRAVISAVARHGPGGAVADAEANAEPDDVADAESDAFADAKSVHVDVRCGVQYGKRELL